MPVSTAPQEEIRVSPEAYLERERKAEEKSEYYRGKVSLMSGGTRNHIMLSSNLAFALRRALSDKDCLVFPSDMRVYVEAHELFTYPDLSVVCGEEEYVEGETQANLLNPTLLVEILSESTERYDRGQKFAFYRDIPSLEEYVLVAQERKQVEVFRKNEAGRWELFEFGAEAEIVELASVKASLPLDAIYEHVV